MFKLKYSIEDMMKGRAMELKEHGINASEIDALSTHEEKMNLIFNRPAANHDNDNYLFAIATNKFLPDSTGAFDKFYDAKTTTGDSAEVAFKLMLKGQGKDVTREQKTFFDKSPEYSLFGEKEKLSLSHRDSDLVIKDPDGTTIHIESKVGCPKGEGTKTASRQELYGDRYRLDNDPNTKQIYLISYNKNNGSCYFDDRKLCEYYRIQKELSPDKVDVIINQDGNFISLSVSDLKRLEQRPSHMSVKNSIDSINQSNFISSFKNTSSSHAGKLFGGIGAAGAASGSSINWGKIITSIIAVLVVLALIVGVVVLLAKILPPVFEAIGQFFVNLWNGICNFFGAIGRFFANIGRGIWNFIKGIGNFFKGLFSSDTLEEDSSLFMPYEEVKTFNIIYELDGGTNSENNPATYEITAEVRKDEDGNIENHFYDFTASFHINTLNIPTKEGYAFVGWYTNPDKRNRNVKYGEDVTLYAVWTKINTITLIENESNIKTIQFTQHGPDMCGEFSDPVFDKENFLWEVNSVDLPILEDGNGYTFSGWFASSSFNCEPTRTVYGFGDYVFYAGFESPTPGLVIKTNRIDGYVGTKEEVTIPLYYQGHKINEIDAQAFSYTAAKTIHLSSNIEYIGDWAFKGVSVTTIYVPASVGEVHYGAFDACTSLNKIYYGGTMLQWYALTSECTYANRNSCSVVCSDGQITIPSNR